MGPRMLRSKLTEISETTAVSLFILPPWRWRQQILKKHVWYSMRPHYTTFRRPLSFAVTAVKTWTFTLNPSLHFHTFSPLAYLDISHVRVTHIKRDVHLFCTCHWRRTCSSACTGGVCPRAQKGCSLRQAIFSSSAEIENSQEFFNLALAYSENWWLWTLLFNLLTFFPYFVKLWSIKNSNKRDAEIPGTLSLVYQAKRSLSTGNKTDSSRQNLLDSSHKLFVTFWQIEFSSDRLGASQ